MSQNPQYVRREQATSFDMNDPSNHSRGSSGSSGIEALSKLIGRSASHFSMPGAESGMLSPLSLQTVANAPEHGRQDPLYQWYCTRDGPWDPVSRTVAIPGCDDAQTSLETGAVNSRTGMPPSAFPGFRASGVPSECETLLQPSDSGYGSAAKLSVGNPSVFGDYDRNADTRSIIGGHLPDFQYRGMRQNAPETSEVDSQPDLLSQSRSCQSAKPTTNPEARPLVCPTCKSRVKTQSELNKHHHRHTKPFLCDVPGCGRKEGFSTPNDLDRHKRSVHHKYDLPSGGNVYRCMMGPCRGKEKIWPRADNFRSHLRRVHRQSVGADDDLEAYVHRSPPLNDEYLAGLGSSVEFESPVGIQFDPPTITSQTWMGMEPRPDIDLNHARGGQPVQARGFIPRPNDPQSAHGPDFMMMELSPDRQSEDTGGILGLTPGDESLQLDQVLSSPENSRGPAQELRMPSEDPQAVLGRDCIQPGQECIQPGVLSNCPVAPPVPRKHNSNSRRNEVGVLDDDQRATMNERHLPNSPESAHEPASDHQSKATRVANGASLKSPDNGLDDAISSNAADSDEETQSQDESSDNSSPSQPKSVDSSAEDIRLDDEDKASALIRSLQEKGLLEKLVEELGYQKAKGSSGKCKKPTAPPQPSENQVPCEKCDKTFNRRCELRKHMKRHEKPYGCTFQQCRKRFGSKNDWKRHENSQHFQLEVWKCNEKVKGSPNIDCEKVCHRRETFKIHLQKDHDIQDAKLIESKWEDCRLGRNCEARFWCGFCQQIIEIRQKGLGAWTERFNHIDDHFSGRNLPKKRISEWKNVDPEQPEVTSSSSDGEDGSGPGSPDPGAGPHDGRGILSAGKRKRVSIPDEHGPKRPRTSLSESPCQDQSKVVWYCCVCSNMSLLGTTHKCMEASCNGHIRCDDCTAEYLNPPEAREIMPLSC